MWRSIRLFKSVRTKHGALSNRGKVRLLWDTQLSCTVCPLCISHLLSHKPGGFSNLSSLLIHSIAPKTKQLTFPFFSFFFNMVSLLLYNVVKSICEYGMVLCFFIQYNIAFKNKTDAISHISMLTLLLERNNIS